MNPGHRYRTPTRRTPSLRALALGLAAGLLGLALAGASQAQMTAEGLIGDSVSQPDSPRYSEVGEAIKRYSNGDIVSAKALLESAVRKDPRLPPVSVLMAKLHRLAGNSQAIRSALEESVNEAPNDPEPYLILAEEAIGDGRMIEAEALFDKAIKLMEGFDTNATRKRSFTIRAYSGRARIALRREEWQQAESDLNTWLEVDPDNAAAHLGLGQAMFMRGEVQQGFGELRKAKELNDSLPHPYVSAAQLYERRDSMSNAMTAYERAYEQGKTNEVTVVSYGQALLKNGDFTKANEIIKTGLEAHPDSVNLLTLAGVGARMAGDNQAAEEHLLRALALSPRNGSVYNQLALLLVDDEGPTNKQRALAYATTNKQINPNNGDVTITLAWVLFQNGDARRATAALQEGVTQGGLSADSSFLLAKLLLTRDRTEDAKALINRALSDDSGIFVQRAEAEQRLAQLN